MEPTAIAGALPSWKSAPGITVLVIVYSPGVLICAIEPPHNNDGSPTEPDIFPAVPEWLENTDLLWSDIKRPAVVVQVSFPVADIIELEKCMQFPTASISTDPNVVISRLGWTAAASADDEFDNAYGTPHPATCRNTPDTLRQVPTNDMQYDNPRPQVLLLNIKCLCCGIAVVVGGPT